MDSVHKDFVVELQERTNSFHVRKMCHSRVVAGWHWVAPQLLHCTTLTTTVHAPTTQYEQGNCLGVAICPCFFAWTRVPAMVKLLNAWRSASYVSGSSRRRSRTCPCDSHDSTYSFQTHVFNELSQAVPGGHVNLIRRLWKHRTNFVQSLASAE